MTAPKPHPDTPGPLSLFEAHLPVLERVTTALARAGLGPATELVHLAACVLLRAATEWRADTPLAFSAYAEVLLNSELLRHVGGWLPPVALPAELAPYEARLAAIARGLPPHGGLQPQPLGGGALAWRGATPLAALPPAAELEEAPSQRNPGVPWRAMRRHLPAVLALVAATELGVLAHSWNTPPVWLASATLNSGIGSKSLLGGGGDWFTQGTMVANVTELLKSRTVLLAVIEALRLEGTPEQLAKRITVSRLGQAGLLRVEAEADDARAAAELANTLVREFMRYYATSQSEDARSDKAFFEAQTRAASKRLKQAEEALARFKREQVPEMQATVPARTSELMAQRDEAARTLAATTAALAVVQRELGAIRRDPLLSQRILNQNAVVTAGDRLRELAANLGDARALYGANSPVVKGLEAQLARARSQLQTSTVEAVEQNPALAEARARLVQLRADAAGARARVASLDAAIARMRPQAREASQNQVRHEQLAREVKVAEGQYLDLQTRLGQSALAAVGATSVPVSVVDPAVPPLQPESSRLALKLLLGALLSLGLGGLGSYMLALRARARQPEAEPAEAAPVPAAAA